ncbi:Ent-kaur-16-ene synthase, chloroplastic [Apostasia shenzhenica]|uniref:Ent-kaur-16-ene synthase, chloroplastic n=1 Tax=Apostasia shenzhenica TaxID=1088818 RepID=A0A2I0A9M4_9ASPA|nr:Ent-kaur-16-ene synthase, chloroplastic [Apostasia shenzhenica]
MSSIATFKAFVASNSCKAFASRKTMKIDRDFPQDVEDLLERSKRLINSVKESLFKVELSVSSYDTAWVAMVPSPGFVNTPCFPECVDWMIDNQLPDGSWGLPHHDPFLIKDILSSTLACILALSRWNVGEEHVKRGLSYIESHFSFSMNDKLLSPIGFNIIFPGMINYALDMGLDLPIRETDINKIFSIRDLELQRESKECSVGSTAYLAFIAEGLCKLQDWRELMNYQRKNGSLFNSPATTAAALTQGQDDKALSYLSSVLQKFSSAVPTTYPLDLRINLSMVDRLERLGISHHFVHEIKEVLDRAYRCWVHNDEEIYSDISTCAMAFRLLRMHGYDLSSDAFSQFSDATQFKNTVQGHFKDYDAAIELCKVSQTQVLAEEPVLEKLNSWVTRFLKEELNSNAILSLDTAQEADYVLRFPFYANLERLEHKRNIEHYNFGSLQMLKTSFLSSIDRRILELAVDEFSNSQLIYRKELQYLESWVKEIKLDQLKFSRQKQTYCYLSAAASLFSADLSDARICWAKGGVLTTVVDDFFDGGGSAEEQSNLIMLIEGWHENHQKDFCSESVEIIFFALYNTVNDLSMKAFFPQKRDVTSHIVNIWLHMMKSMKVEAEWLKNNTVPSIDEYMAHAIPSFALGPIVLPSLYFVGPVVSEDAIESPEYFNLFKLVSKLGRLLNDYQGFERDLKDGKMNSVSLRIQHGNGSISKEDARRETMRTIESTRAELLGLVLQEKGSKVPKSCKELFWKMSKILHLFYKNTDGFTSPKEMLGAVNAVIHEPLKVSHLLLSAD